MATFRMNKIIITLLILISATAYGADVDNALLQKNLDAANAQIDVLKAQIEVMKSYQDNFLATVYWSLGGVITLTILLIGSNWFINIRNQDKEAELLQEKINNHIAESNTKLTATFEEYKNENIKIVNSEKSKVKKDIEENILLKLKTKDNQLRHELSNLKKDVSKLDTDYWLKRGVYNNAIRAQLSILKSPIIVRTDFSITQCFEEIERILRIIETEGKNKCLNAKIVTEINEVLKGYEETYSLPTAKINGILVHLTNSKI